MAAAAVAFAMAGGAASASTVIDFTTGADLTAASIGFTEDSITATATAVRDCFGLGSANVSKTSDGLGVAASDGCLSIFDSPALDGQVDEGLILTFDQTVVFESVAFDYIDSDDPYDIYVDSGSGFSLVESVDPGLNPYDFMSYLTGTALAIVATDNASAFRVESVTVSAIPLPAGGLLLLGGLGGLAALKRRRKAA